MENVQAPPRVLSQRRLPLRRVSRRVLWLCVDVLATAACLLHALIA